jgi:16S rRNA processing protein RimM
VFIQDRPYLVKALRRVDRGYQVAFEDVDLATAEEIRGLDVFVPSRRALEEGEYWPETLIGLEARGSDGLRLGTVVRVVAGLAQDRLVIDSNGTEFEVPFVDALVPVVDTEGGFVEVVDLPGLIEP